MTNYWQRMWWTGALCCQTSSSRHSNGAESYGSVCEPICEQIISRRKSTISENTTTNAAAVTPPSSTDAFLFHQRVEEYRSILPSARFNMDGRRAGSQGKKKISMGGGGGLGGGIRSPLVKRDQHSQVVIRGWLYKLEGSLAMKQWKKRWFVLADFCLFFYKDSDEEKLLGSILLPSYKINPCISEDRISKKFAFKAEHHNMKTYYFASDSKESLSQWMNAMSLATIMQKDTTCDVLAERGYGSPVLLDDEESGFSSYRARRIPQQHHPAMNYHPSERHHVRSHPGAAVYPENARHSREFENGYVSGEINVKYRTPSDGGPTPTPRRHPGQPLYANAPPKPRRLTGSYPHDQGASGSDFPLEYSDSSQISDYYPGSAGNTSSSSYRQAPPPHERESLDYSSDWPPGMPYQDNYVYGSGYYPTSDRERVPVRNEVELPPSASHYHVGHVPAQPPRPHSADFLERQSAVDNYAPPQINSQQVKARQRPKSSLEQYDRRHYWEDESPRVSDHGHNYSYEVNPGVAPDLGGAVRDHWNTPRRTSDYAIRNMDNSSSSIYSQSPSSTLRGTQTAYQVPLPYDYGLPEVPDHPKKLIENDLIPKDANEVPVAVPGLTKWPTMHPGYPVDPKYFTEPRNPPDQVVVRRPSHDHHGRNRPLSAEYKLGDPAYSQTKHPNYQQQEELMCDRDQKKVQLREESMRRLLEWKQRMLQSPLTRKYSPRSQQSPRSSPSHSSGRSNVQIPIETSPVTPTSPPARPPLPEEYRQKVLQDLENHEARLRIQESSQLPPDSVAPRNYYSGSYGADYGTPPPALMKARDVENQPPPLIYSNEKVNKGQEVLSKTSSRQIVMPNLIHDAVTSTPVKVKDVDTSVDSNATIEDAFKVDGKTDVDKGSGPKYHGQFRNQDPRKSSMNRMGQHPSYSSDDEEYETKQRNRRSRRPSQASSSLSKCKNVNPDDLDRPNQAPSPDYVNLNMVKKRHKVNVSSQQYENVSKTNLNDNAADENEDYYIRREDYYRASQLFYAKTNNKSPKTSKDKVRSPSNKYDACDFKDTKDFNRNFTDYSMEERSLGDGIESSTSNLDDGGGTPLNDYRYSQVGLPVISKSAPTRGREHPKYVDNRIRSQSLPRKATRDNFYTDSNNQNPRTPDVCQLENFNYDLSHQDMVTNVHLQRSSSTDMIDTIESRGEFHRQASLRNVSESKRTSGNGGSGNSTLKHNFSFEEMRTQLARQREAPPANIVSQRIKHFESTSVEALDDASCKKGSPPAIGIGELLTKGTNSSVSSDSYLIVEDIRKIPSTPCGSVKNELSFETVSPPQHKEDNKLDVKMIKSVEDSPSPSSLDKHNWQSSFQRRQFCSDSDVGRSLCKKDSNSTTEDSSIASAPIILSPLSSVLADLRRTADTKKEKKRGATVDEVIITKGALRLSLAESKEINLDKFASEESLKADDNQEEEYLTMTKGKTTEDEEAVYVAMDVDPESQAEPKIEPVYNEPVTPPSSFLHDIFGKQKPRSNYNQKQSRDSYSSSSSDDDDSNNVYEKPNWKKDHIKTYPNEPPVYEEPYSMTPYRPWDVTAAQGIDTARNHHQDVEESIPDLLNHHEEGGRKDTDASDADDEASRDFDTPRNNRNGLPSYQKEILMGEHSLTESDSQFDQSRALPLIPKYSSTSVIKTNVLEKKQPTKIDSIVKEVAPTLAMVEPMVRKINTSTTDESGPNSFNDFRPDQYKHFKVYEDERRCTEFVFKPAVEKGTSISSTVNLKQVRIYKEGKEPGKLKFYSHSASSLGISPNENTNQDGGATDLGLIRSKPKLSLDSQLESQLHLHVKPLHSYSDEAETVIGTTPTITTSDVAIVSSSISEARGSVNTSYTSTPSKQFGLHAKSSSYDNSTPTYQTTPDVVPGGESSHRRNSSSSAPYYYSDLLPNGLPAPRSNQDFLLRVSPSPRSSRALLNNVRDVSPNHAKGDIGRKVNVIQESPVVLNNAGVNEESASVSMARELRASLEQLLSSESKKFLDAERNKYEAGHTLEKTHHTSTFSKLKKQRSSTPDFDNLYRSNEPEYENLSATRNQSGNTLTRRLSRSLEGLIDLGSGVSETPPAVFNDGRDEWLDLATNTDRNEQCPPSQPILDKEEPFYENIIFIRSEEKIRETINDKFEGSLASSQVLEVQVQQDVDSLKMKNTQYHNVLDHNHGGRTLVLNSLGDERDSDSEYLDENILRRESQRHFLAQGLGEKTLVGAFTSPKGNSLSPKQAIIVPNPNPNLITTSTISQLETTLQQDVHHTPPRISDPVDIVETFRGAPPGNNPEYFGYLSTDSSSDMSSGHKDGKTLGDSIIGTSSVSDEHMGRQRLRQIAALSKDNLNSSDSELHKQTSSKVRRLIQRSQGLSREGKRLSISAGDLLEKSHEELVLLLIQLRRTLSRVAKTREKCHAQLESAQLINRTRDKSLQNWEELKAQIQELEKQYDMTQPLVNLVENMVKLGSLYRGHEKRTLAASTAKLLSYVGQDQIYTPSQNLVEFSNNVVEGETRSNLNHGIYNLYELNRGYHAESANLMSLHQDKDMLEWTLDSVKGKVNGAGDNAMLVQKLKKQQLLLEKELNRVHNLLSHSAAKIEELTKENGKQEKEILILKQKVQHALKNTSLDKMPLARANLESELNRVQSVIEELSHQRTEVANSIETLKQESQQSVASRSSTFLGSPVRASPTGVAGSIPLPVRRKCQTTYLETDLDSLETRDLARIPSQLYFGRENDAPLYVNTDEINDDKLGNGNESSVESPPEAEYYNNKTVLMSLESAEADRMLDDFYNSQSNDINEADERMKRFYGILPREKPSEIKTVRIVKRESERRSRVRKKVSYDENHSLVWLVEEPDTLLSEGEETDDGVFQDDPFPGVQNRPTTLFFPPQVQSSFPSAREQLFGGQTSICSPSSSSSEFRTPITPLFLLNKPHYPPTTQTTTTTSTASSLDYRAPFKKAKRRHYTISGSQPSMEQNWIKNTEGLRSRDDMDMERCLRTVNTPDIVRSTIKKVDVFDEKLIERELSLPQKIVIPERYIEVEPPEELSASEKLRRKLKAETIRKMLSETTTYEDIADEKGPTETLRKKLDEEKKKRAHLLALNHTIAKEVMERSKMVAAIHTSPEPPPSNN